MKKIKRNNLLRGEMTSLEENIEFFKKQYGEEIYKQAEENDLFKCKVQLKSDSSYIGKVISLWLPKDESKYRTNDLYLVKWDNGYNGLIEEKDVQKMV